MAAGRLALAHLRHQAGRTTALAAGILVAVVAFVVLTGSVETSQLRTTQSVNANYRSAYDILVRPSGNRTGLEAQRGLVRPNYLSGIYGGITLAQLKKIKSIPGVEIAAPIAMLGQILESVTVPIDLTRWVQPGRRQVLKFSATQLSMRGLSHAPGSSGFSYISPVDFDSVPPLDMGEPYGPAEDGANGKKTIVCPEALSLQPPTEGAFSPQRMWSPSCWSQVSGLNGAGWSELGANRYGALVQWSFPVLLAAIDPDAEAKLAGIKSALKSGRYLTENESAVHTGAGVGRRVQIPVLASSNTVVDETSKVQIERLPARYAAAIAGGLSKRQAQQLISSAKGQHVGTETVTAQEAYQQFLLYLRTHPGDQSVDNYWTAGPVTYTRDSAGHLHPHVTSNPDSTWQSSYQNGGYVDVPSDASGTSYRTLTPHLGSASGAVGSGLKLPGLDLVGTFDTGKLRGFSKLSALPLGTYQPPQAAPAGTRSRKLLDGKDLVPNLNPAGYLQQPPLLLTTLDALPALTDPAVFSGADNSAPISVIRIRVAGVSGSDAVSRERVRLVAQQIRRATGLDVDITIGSSPTAELIDLPATAHGAPALTVREGWVKKGVAVRLLRQIDEKSLLLFVLILAVCALVVANATSAAVRSRRGELAVLSCLGWTRGRLYREILTEVLGVGLVAGVVGSVASIPIAALLGDHVSVPRATLAIPAALCLAALAGAVPAWRASRVDAINAVRASATSSHKTLNLRGVGGLAVVNLLRAPGRTLLGVTALAIGVCALSILLGIKTAFHGAVVGTLLGDAIDVQVRGADVVAAVLMLVLGLAAVADILYLDVREQASSYAALQSSGWTNSAIARLVLTQAGLIGLTGAVVGGAAGLAITASLTGQLAAAMWPMTVLVVVCASVLAMAAAAIPAAILRKLPTAALLAGDD